MDGLVALLLKPRPLPRLCSLVMLLAEAALTTDPGEWWREVAALHAAANRRPGEAVDEDWPGH